MFSAETVKCLVSRRNWTQISNGCCGRVYSAPRAKWVWKIAINDGTRAFYEWCMTKCARGERMMGMPEIDFLAPVDSCRYLVAMKKYRHIRDREWQELGWLSSQENQGSIHSHDGCPQYILDLLDAFQNDTELYADDLHYRNVMFDEDSGEVIVTDPSSAGYTPLGAEQEWKYDEEGTYAPTWRVPEFQLEMQYADQ